MKGLFILLFSMVMAGEMTVDGNLTVVDTLHVTTIQSAAIDSLLSLIAQLEMRIAQLECQNTGIIPDGYCDCFFHTLDECGVCGGTCDTWCGCDGICEAVEDVCGDCGGGITDVNECENYAVEFDGNGDCILIPYEEQYNFNNGTSFTIEMWIKSDEEILHRDFIWQFGNEAGNIYQIYLRRNNDTDIEFNISSNETQIAPNSFYQGNWIHIAGVFDAETYIMHLFVDGQLKGSKENIVLQDYGQSRVLIGCDQDNGELDDPSDFFSGLIDEVRISNVVRYNTTFTPQDFFANDENTIGLWHFNQNLYDSSIYQNNNGTMVGNPEWVER